MRPIEIAGTRFATWFSRFTTITSSRICAFASFARSTNGSGFAGLSDGRRCAKSKSLSRNTTSAGISVPSVSTIFTSVNSLSNLNCDMSVPRAAIARVYVSFMALLGSVVASETTVKPEGSMTVPVVSVFDSDFESRPPIEMLCLIANFTVTTACWYFARIARPDFAASSACTGNAANPPNTASAMDKINVKCLLILVISFRDLLVPVPVRFQLQKYRVNPARNPQYDALPLLRCHVFHLLLQRQYVRHRLTIDRRDDVPNVQPANRGPSPILDFRDHRPRPPFRPFLMHLVVKRHVPHRELKILIAVLLHLAFEFRRAHQLHRQAQLVRAPHHAQRRRRPDLVLPHHRVENFFIAGLRGGNTFAVERENQIANLQPRFLRRAIRVNLRDAHAVQSRAAQLLRQIPRDRLRRNRQPCLLRFKPRVLNLFQDNLRHRQQLLRPAQKSQPRRHRLGLARGNLLRDLHHLRHVVNGRAVDLHQHIKSLHGRLRITARPAGQQRRHDHPVATLQFHFAFRQRRNVPHRNAPLLQFKSLRLARLALARPRLQRLLLAVTQHDRLKLLANRQIRHHLVQQRDLLRISYQYVLVRQPH